MRSEQCGVLLIFLAIGLPVWAQQAKKQTSKSPFPRTAKMSDLFQPTRDPQALTIANQALSAAGGATAIMAIKDYTATGTMTLNSSTQDSQVALTISGLGVSDFRIDTNVSKGVSSIAMYRGKVSTLDADGSVKSSFMRTPLAPSTLLFPHLLLAKALSTPLLSLLYEGLVGFNGNQVHDLRVQQTMPQGTDPKGYAASLSAVDILIDPSTFQIVATRDMIRSKTNMSVGHFHEIQYSQYQTVNGVSIPYSISESVDQQKPRLLQVSSISVNSGLTDTQFQLQPATHQGT